MSINSALELIEKNCIVDEAKLNVDLSFSNQADPLDCLIVLNGSFSLHQLKVCI